ncbi:glycosyltransferase family 2 protein [Zasmidium cellare ATCC 36951]|uniref:chitin synthase n=1 Tax=Zasmidium cellare ATCC 36951 TaxID=1080233 RepID=A0A6A6CM47_ZASCE|nr:glycosyltransferase family 2 protein [Zasmidium cellare ATCC 36951]KAF2168307.1 glycosyltransferase family 2 protein [Zasmidium cellare ATCC 36951]
MLFPRADDGVPPITAQWPVKDIVYVAIVGTVMLAALLEWILWLLAFLYCLVKVFQKATDESRWSIRILCILNSIFFIGMRCVFLPIMVVTLPLPAQVVQYFPEEMVEVLQWFAFYSFAGLLTIPWLFCVYQLVTHNVGRQRKIKTVLDEFSAPKVVIIMPCYNEEPDILLRTVDSMVECDYPASCLHIFLSFDGDQENELYLNTIEKLGIPLTLDTYPKSIDVNYHGCRITVSRFPHGGKRSCQKKTFRLIDKVYAEYLRRNDNLFLLFIDSDCILDKVCIQNFVYEMELKPGSKHNMLAMTGVITSTTEKNTLITVLQDMEYIHGQLFERSVESGCGAVTCLPGALTILRFSAFRKMAKYYFADKTEQCDDLFDYGKCHLGEDRWLTHLFMIGAQERYQIQMNTGAFCKTEAVQTFRSLLKQRRRWFLGFITNEVCMLTDIRLWTRYPILLLIRLAQNTIRTTALLFFIMVISILTTSQKVANLPVGFIAVSLGLNWALMLYFGAKLGRYKIMLYPLMFVLNPFFNWLYMVYGIFTAGSRTWGGPRADAGKADETKTPEQAVAEAQAMGDELNVVPETFRPAVEIARQKSLRTPLMPSSRLEGRFAPAEALPGGWYQQVNDSGQLRPDMAPRGDEEMVIYHKGPRRDSTDSFLSSQHTIHTPRRVESIFGFENARDYHGQQHEQLRAALESAIRPQRAVPAFSNGPLLPASRTRDSSVSSLRSAESDSSVDMHFGVPSCAPVTVAGPSQPSPSAPQSRPAVRAPTRHTEPRERPSTLSAPEAAYRPTGRFSNGDQSSALRTARSPLARKSYTRLATDDAPSTAGTSTEVEVRVPTRTSETDDEQPRGRRRRTSTSVGPDGRRRLSKQPRGKGSRSSSRACM